MNTTTEFHRKIQTFIRRSSPLTHSQRIGIEQHADHFVVEVGAEISSTRLFANTHPLVVEIGFGMGQALVRMAHQNPSLNFVGIEVHKPGVAQICYDAYQLQINNLRILEADALELLQQHCPDHSLHRIQLFFPDPWPKKKHHKRRIIQKANADLFASKLQSGGMLHVATDWQPYAEWILEIMDSHDAFENQAGKGHYAARPDERPLTKFEQRGINAGHSIADLIYIRKRTDV